MNFLIGKLSFLFFYELETQEEFADVMARVESLRGRMGESTRGVEGLFESLLAEAFDGQETG